MIIKNQINIANEMNRQFTEMGAKLAANLETTDKLFTDYLEFRFEKFAFYSTLLLIKAYQKSLKRGVPGLDISYETGYLGKFLTLWY